jgi:signal transduction histidine kinase
MERAEDILDALLYSVSHDLRSPLLTLSLSAELIRESLREVVGPEMAGSTGVALDALKQGADDLERMLKALTTLSRARRRQQEIRRVPLRVLLGGHIVISEIGDLDRIVVPIDATPVRELIDRLCGEDPAEIQLSRTESHVVLRLPARILLPKLEDSPLIELARSLQLHAGTIVEDLASLQVQLARQSIVMEVSARAILVAFPISAGSAT